MRRIYLPIILILCIASFYAGYKVGEPKIDTSDVQVIDKRLDSLDNAMRESLKREQSYKELMAKDYIKVLELEEELITREKEQQKIRRYYEKKIKEAEKYTLTQLDSFFNARYPRPGIRYTISDSTVARTNGGRRLDTLRFTNERADQDSEGLQNHAADSSATFEDDRTIESDSTREGSTGTDSTTESTGGDEVQADSNKIQTPAESHDRWRFSYSCWRSYPIFKTVDHRLTMHPRRMEALLLQVELPYY